MRCFAALICALLIPLQAFAGPINSYPVASSPLAADTVIGTHTAVTSQFTLGSIAALAAGQTLTWTQPQNLTVANILGPTTSDTYPGNWDSGSGGTIQRLTNRVFIGDATLNSGVVTSTADWFSALTGAAYQAGGNSMLLVETTNGLDGVVGASQSLHAGAAGTPIAGGSFFGVLNNASFANTGDGLYTECRAYLVGSNNANAGCSGLESDTVNLTGATGTQPDPFAPYPSNFYFGEQIACGGGFNGTSGAPNFGVTASPCTSAINIAANGSQFQSGITIDFGALTSTYAMKMPYNTALAWYASAGTVINFIEGTANTNTNGGSVMQMTDGGTYFENTAGALSVFLGTGLNNVNSVSISGSTTGNPVGFTAVGSDSSIGIRFNTKGSGVLNINGTNGVACSGTPTSSFAAVGGIVTHC